MPASASCSGASACTISASARASVPTSTRCTRSCSRLGATIVHAPEEVPWAPGYYSVLFEDPDGIRLEVNHVPGKGLLATDADRLEARAVVSLQSAARGAAGGHHRRCGAGGSGDGAAARAARARRWPPDTLLLDKARHPRDKTCAGGVIPKASALLASLGRAVRRAAGARRRARRWRFPGARSRSPGDDLCRVVRRREFDARLAWAARDRGVELREDAPRARRRPRRPRACGSRPRTRAFWAPVVVGRGRQRQPGAPRAGRRPTPGVRRARGHVRRAGRRARHGTDTPRAATISTSGPSRAACAAMAGRSRAGSTASRT